MPVYERESTSNLDLHTAWCSEALAPQRLSTAQEKDLLPSCLCISRSSSNHSCADTFHQTNWMSINNFACSLASRTTLNSPMQNQLVSKRHPSKNSLPNRPGIGNQMYTCHFRAIPEDIVLPSWHSMVRTGPFRINQSINAAQERDPFPLP